MANEDFNRILLVIRSVKGESWWQRRKVLKKVKEWRKNNSYQVIDYSVYMAEYQAQTALDLEVGKHYTISKNTYFYKNGNIYGKSLVTVDTGLTFLYTEEGCKFLEGMWLPSKIASLISEPATPEAAKLYREKQARVDAIQGEIDRYKSLMEQNIAIREQIIYSK